MKRKFEIIELEEKNYESVKDLLVDLQRHIIEIDKYNLNVLTSDYREKYFDYMLCDCKMAQGKCFVCVDKNDNVLGMIAGYLQEYDDRDRLDYVCPKKGLIAELVVDKNHRKDGVGTKLVKFMENYFKSIGCEFVQIDVFAYNTGAKNFYYKNGYEDRMVTVFKKIGD